MMDAFKASEDEQISEAAFKSDTKVKYNIATSSDKQKKL